MKENLAMKLMITSFTSYSLNRKVLRSGVLFFCLISIGLAAFRIEAAEGGKKSPSEGAPEQSLFIGKWVPESVSGMFYELDIRSTDQGLVVHYWFDEGRGLRDSGEVLSKMSDNKLVNSKDIGFAEYRNTHSLTEEGQLKYIHKTIFTDNSGRRDSSRTYILKRISSTPTLSGPAPAPAARKSGKIKKTIKGKISAADGSPVHGADIIQEWRYYNGKLQRRPEIQATTDKEGAFSLLVYFRSGKPLTFIVKNIDQTEGAIFKSFPDVDEEYQVTLEKTVEVKVQLEVNGSTNVDVGGWPGIHFRSHNDGVRLSSVWGRYGGSFSFHLPVGIYRMETSKYSSSNGSVFESVLRNINVDGSKESIDLGIINVTSSEPITQVRRGVRAPDWVITDARGIEPSVKIEDFKGKWVLLDFWGYWCGPCIQKMPELFQFYEEFKGSKEKFEILAFHSSDVHKFEFLDMQMKGIIEKNFKGEKIPFPIVLDSTRKTCNNYHINAYPTMILINPEGTIESIGHESLDILRGKLR